MNSNTIAARVKTVLESRILFFLIGLTVWVAGIMSGSITLMVLCSLAVYAMPFVYVVALNRVENAPRGAERPGLKPVKRVSLTHNYGNSALAADTK